ncbi:MAG: SDR family NAD(P)-dependent oxidoreductase, partial [Clostridia bacterium]|nr:SDR family NAD(P)-dependent oxidoreductase [Clostridia bacterium]
MRFEGKVAVVTGAAQGIGAAIAKRLYDDGAAFVAMVDLNKERLEAQALVIDPTCTRAGAYVCNVASCKETAEVFSKIESERGPISILVNNAGITRDAMFHKMNEDQWDSVITVNLKSMYNCCQAVVPGMRARKYGKIVNLAS